MPTVLANPTFNLSNLNELENKIIENRATIEDYQLLEAWAANVFNLQAYFTNKMKENNIYNFNHFIDLRKQPPYFDKSIPVSIMLGHFKGMISALRDYLTPSKNTL